MTAAEMILKKALVAANISSDQWNSIQAGLRERAFFSARITKLRILEELRKETSNVASGEKSASEVRRDIRKYLEKVGYTPDPGEEGTIKDLFSRARLDVIIKTNVDQARGWAQHLEATTSGALKAFPAYELVRVEEREQPRNWAAKWAAAGGQFYGSRMIALKTDSIWTRISRFGNPYPPFDYNSGMGVADVSRSECLALGVISEDDEPQTPPPNRDFNENLSATFDVGHWNDDLAKFIKKEFEDQIMEQQDAAGNVKITWNRSILKDIFDNPAKYKNMKSGWKLGKATDQLLKKCDEAGKGLRELVENRGLNINVSIANHTIADGHWLVDKHKGNMPVKPQDLDLVPVMWKNPDNVDRGKDERSLVLNLETLDGGILHMPIQVKGIIPVPTGLYKEEKKDALE